MNCKIRALRATRAKGSKNMNSTHPLRSDYQLREDSDTVLAILVIARSVLDLIQKSYTTLAQNLSIF